MYANPTSLSAVEGRGLLRRFVALNARARKPVGWLLCVAALLGWSGLAPAQALPQDEELDSLLYTFASFTRWPTGTLRTSAEPLLICLQGTSASLRSQQPVTRGAGTGIAVRRVVATDDLRRCHLLYVPASEQHRLRDIVASVTGAPVLTVSDAEGALDEGAVIELSSRVDRIQFEVNLEAARRNHLVISSKLLRVARRVVHTASHP